MKNVAASVRAKLLNLSRAKGVPLNALMEQYATGRVSGGRPGRGAA
jgi:hypothetical protein